MKIGEFLHNCDKDTLPFILYSGTGKGYKICCLDCEFFKPENNYWNCESAFYYGCKEEFGYWLKKEIPKEIPNEY